MPKLEDAIIRLKNEVIKHEKALEREQKYIKTAPPIQKHIWPPLLKQE